MSRRTEQVQDVIQKELGMILAREIEFPLKVFPNIIKVDVPPDLRNATVWLGVVPAEARDEVLEAINNDIGAVQKLLNRRMPMKFVPRLHFKIDESIDKVMRVSELVDRIKSEDDGESKKG